MVAKLCSRFWLNVLPFRRNCKFKTFRCFKTKFKSHASTQGNAFTIVRGYLSTIHTYFWRRASCTTIHIIKPFLWQFFRKKTVLSKFIKILKNSKNYLNSKHRNIRFTCEKELNNSLSFFNVLITRTSNGSKTSVYHKPTFSGAYSRFNSFISEKHKVGFDFHFKILNIFNCFEFFKISFKRVSFKENIKKDAFSIKLVDSSIKTFLNETLTETLTKKLVTLTTKKKI